MEMDPAARYTLRRNTASEDFFYLIWFTLNSKQLQCVVGSDYLGFDFKVRLQVLKEQKLLLLNIL